MFCMIVMDMKHGDVLQVDESDNETKLNLYFWIMMETNSLSEESLDDLA